MIQNKVPLKVMGQKKAKQPTKRDLKKLLEEYASDNQRLAQMNAELTTMMGTLHLTVDKVLEDHAAIIVPAAEPYVEALKTVHEVSMPYKDQGFLDDEETQDKTSSKQTQTADEKEETDQPEG